MTDDKKYIGAAEVPATFSNYFVVHRMGGIRITFGEKMGSDDDIHYRTSVMLLPDDAVALRNLLTEQIKQLEEDIKKTVEVFQDPKGNA